LGSMLRREPTEEETQRVLDWFVDNKDTFKDGKLIEPKGGLARDQNGALWVESVGCNEDVLVFAITAHCRDQNHNDQSSSAERFGITPQGVTEIFKGRNQPKPRERSTGKPADRSGPAVRRMNSVLSL
jgi:hypothetical protein